MGRGARARHRGREACLETRLHLLAMVIPHVRHDSKVTIENFFGLQGHRTEPSAGTWIVRHLAGDHQFVLRVYSRLHVIADCRATALRTPSQQVSSELRVPAQQWAYEAGGSEEAGRVIEPRNR